MVTVPRYVLYRPMCIDLGTYLPINSNRPKHTLYKIMAGKTRTRDRQYPEIFYIYSVPTVSFCGHKYMYVCYLGNTFSYFPKAGALCPPIIKLDDHGA